jgi:hypothetical protein
MTEEQNEKKTNKQQILSLLREGILRKVAELPEDWFCYSCDKHNSADAVRDLVNAFEYCVRNFPDRGTDISQDSQGDGRLSEPRCCQGDCVPNTLAGVINDTATIRKAREREKTL